MPLHKSSRAPRLDPTMISAPLGDFRHTMHIGRGGDAFGDTSFLSSHGPAGPDANAPGNLPGGVIDSQTTVIDDIPKKAAAGDLGSAETDGIQHSESVSSFTLDLDLDLGPSMLGDILGVMDGLGLDSDWTSSTNEEEVFTPNGGGGSGTTETKQCKSDMSDEEGSVGAQNELNGNKLAGDEPVDGGRITDENGTKPKGLRPKVRFSDKRDEIIRQASEEDEGQGFDFQDDDNELECGSPTVGEAKRGSAQPPLANSSSSVAGGVGAGEAEATTNHKAEVVPPSPASSSSHSSEYEGVTPLDRRRVDSCHSETDSDEEEEEGADDGRGYTFEDEFDDEIGL